MAIREPHFMTRSIEEIFSITNIREVFDSYIKRSSSIGVDGISAHSFADNLDVESEIIHRKILNGSYRFSPYKEKLIIKSANSPPRSVKIPTIRDKLVLRIMLRELTKTFDSVVKQQCSARTTISNVINNFQSNDYDAFIKIDIEKFYPSINHEILFEILDDQLNNDIFSRLIKASFNNRIQDVNRKNRSPDSLECGLPEGLSISGLLANIYLSNIDSIYSEINDISYYRFVDDILLLCNISKKESVEKMLINEFDSIKLKVHPMGHDKDKSESGYINEGFQYLGYEFKGQSISVREKSLDRLYNRIVSYFAKCCKTSEIITIDKFYYGLNTRIAGLIRKNGDLIGWLAYYQNINNHTVLFSLDKFVERCCKRFDIRYDTTKIKKFSRAIYEVRRYPNTNYINNLNKAEKLIDISKLSGNGLSKNLNKAHHPENTEEKNDTLSDHDLQKKLEEEYLENIDEQIYHEVKYDTWEY